MLSLSYMPSHVHVSLDYEVGPNSPSSETISSVQVADPICWPNSPWKLLQWFYTSTGSVSRKDMAWWDNVAETRIVIAPEPGSTISARNGEGCFLFLRHPKSGDTTSYFFINGSIQEFHWFKQSYGSWFIGDYVCEDGCLYTATPIDPIFILLPIFEEARMKKLDPQNSIGWMIPKF
uniref:Rnh202 triple barrel domain-containing protein n=1 Tax=Nelumbo nucifera TaxID=4432 RepID=A0A822ZCT0_NELNU|nr:TPA_asm: hypothetical protein HUJ06_002254 [Nelumbo nucifera]